MSPITTHILDTSLGKPAKGVSVRLDKQNSKGEWTELSHKKTNDDGRVVDLLSEKQKLEKGTYRLSFDTKSYFESTKRNSFYPEVQVTFEVSDANHHHVPLLLSPFGYSTYRGS